MSEFAYVGASMKLSGEAALPAKNQEYDHGDEVYLVVRTKVHEVSFPEDKDGIITRVHKSKAEEAFLVDPEQAESLIAEAKAEVTGQRSIYNEAST